MCSQQCAQTMKYPMMSNVNSNYTTSEGKIWLTLFYCLLRQQKNSLRNKKVKRTDLRETINYNLYMRLTHRV